jgi:hypothetical protein
VVFERHIFNHFAYHLDGSLFSQASFPYKIPIPVGPHILCLKNIKITIQFLNIGFDMGNGAPSIKTAAPKHGLYQSCT